MHAIWTGSIGFGLVNIPVSLFSGSSEHAGIDLDMLHKKDNSPIRYARICKKDGTEIPYDQIVKGYQYCKGEYVVIDKEDFKKADAHQTNTIDIQLFTDESEIDVRYYDKPYYLEPGKGGESAYALLREALEQSGQVAVARYVLREKENIGVLKPVGKLLVLDQMRFPADIRETGELKLPPKGKADPKQMKIALSLINKLSGHFIAEDWHDTYTEKLEDLIAAKVKGKNPKARGSAPKPTDVKDLMDSLKASLEKQK